MRDGASASEARRKTERSRVRSPQGEVREAAGDSSTTWASITLTLSRNAGTLSGGESQRIRLASPDRQRADGGALRARRTLHRGCTSATTTGCSARSRTCGDQGNTVDRSLNMTRKPSARPITSSISAPARAVHGGRIVAQGTPAEIMADPASITGQYLSGTAGNRGARRAAQGQQEKADRGQGYRQQPARGDGRVSRWASSSAVTGVSGGGKSTLTIETLFKTASMKLNGARLDCPRALRDDQGAGTSRQGSSTSTSAPSGGRRARTPRPLQFRRLHPRSATGSQGLPEAKARGLQARAVFLQRQGRPLRGVPGYDGVIKIEMHFLPDVLRHLRNLQGQALQPRNAGGAVQGQVHRRTCST